ncbi:MAG: nitronate monooxygenase [Moraxella sp.]|nr:nitronate monooxygenase [Moraxella sp.]
MPITSLMQRLNLHTPIMQAPMAGASNAEFVAAACHAGALGSLGAGMMSPAAIHAEINQIKALTDKPFNINLMILSNELSERYSAAMPKWLSNKYQALGVTPAIDDKPAQDFTKQLQVLLDNPVPVASFTFGVLESTQVKALHDVGSLVVGTANNVAEVQAWADVGADAVVVQGVEAGGHQGGWTNETAKRYATFELLKLTKSGDIKLPLIAAGGIATAQSVAQALIGGADLVAVGTAFLTTHESPISPLWQEQLFKATGADTRLTRLFSGKLARGVVNDYMREFADIDGAIRHADIPLYPTMNAMTKSLRAYGAKCGDVNLMSLWAGMAVADCRDESVLDLMARLLG